MLIQPFGINIATQGLTYNIMQSDEYTQKILEIFKKRILEGENPNECQEEVYAEAGIINFERDIIDMDKRRIKKEVEEMCRKYAFGILY